MRVVELALPSTERDEDALVQWFIDSLCLVRKQSDATSDLMNINPVHRLLKEYFFAHPTRSWDALQLSEEIGMTPASLNHHLSRFVETGLIGYSNEGQGWRQYFLRGGSIQASVEAFSHTYSFFLSQRIQALHSFWNRSGSHLSIELPENDTPPFFIQVSDYRPTLQGASDLTHWMNDFGLLGERPGKELEAGSISEQLFTLLLNRDEPLSLDEAAELLGGVKARLGRMLERFRQTGFVERIPRTDRLSVSLWTAMTTQYQRRGEDWMLKKGGFQRILTNEQMNWLLKKLATQTLEIPDLDELIAQVEATELMLLLNLLGGRLPLGYRIAGSSVESVGQRVEDKFGRVLRRMKRVADLLTHQTIEN